MVLAAVLGGGSGRRFGGDVPKQFLSLDGEPILLRSLRAFASHPEVDAVVAVVPADRREEAEALIARAGFSCPVDVIAGGATRSGSLKAALDFFAKKYGRENHVVLTHDAARPFVSARIISDNVAAAREFGAANTCLAATDTIFLSADGRFMDSIPPRKTLYHCQTPQTFLLDSYLTMIESLDETEFNAMTDGTAVCLACGAKVAIVPGDPDNIKITYPTDLKKVPTEKRTPYE